MKFGRFAYWLDVFGFYSVQWRSGHAIRKWQGKKLRALVRYMAEHNPLYRELLQKNHVAVDAIRSVEDAVKLPRMNKRDFLGRFPEEYLDTSRRIVGYWSQTSGTTGEPFSFVGDSLVMHELSNLYRQFRFAVERDTPLWKLPHLRIAQIKIRSGKHGNTLFIPVREFLADPAAAIQKLAEFGPDILVSYSSMLLELSRAIEAGIATASFRPRYIVSFGEKLSPSARRYIEKIIGSEVYDRYGTEEFGVVGIECARHEGFHINVESLLIEIVNEKGLPVPSGHSGRIIGTALYNYNMPFIRYETGDRGLFIPNECECGLQSPRLLIDGRYSAFLMFGSTRVQHLEFDGALDGYMNRIIQYQVAKKSEDALTLRVVPGSAYSPQTSEKIHASLRSLLGNGIRLDIELVESIGKVASGKSQIVVDESI